MIERIKEHIFKLFETAPKTSRVNEAKEELLAGCIDKYNDLIKQGKSEEEAYAEVIAGIGDVNELLSTILESNQNYKQDNSQSSYNPPKPKPSFIRSDTDENEKNKILNKSLRGPITSTMWLGTVVIYLLISFITNRWDITWLIFPLAVVVQMFVDYTFSRSKFKRGHMISILWTSCVFIYLFVSMVTGAWGITWILFLIAVAVQQAIILYFAYKKSN
ncbi:MAG: permease prefix domain 1-containing protein [Oscillospiraceae bacterium]|nr:permease prefix domain 1-containing protein [Oscillospiraceae bacterium]